MKWWYFAVLTLFVMAHMITQWALYMIRKDKAWSTEDARLVTGAFLFSVMFNGVATVVLGVLVVLDFL